MEFVREKIKRKPISKKCILIKLLISAICGLVFSLTAGVVMLLILPLLQRDPAQGSGEPKNTQIQLVTQQETDETESASESVSETQDDMVPPGVPDVSLSISDYQELQNQLYKIGSQANRSIVTVTSKTSGVDWLLNDFETVGQGAGVIVSSDSKYYYILTERKNISNAGSIAVTFINDATAEAELHKYDVATGITILTVKKSEVDVETEKSIQVATMGSSYTVTNGKIVIALGSPLGTNYSILTGNITSTENEIHKPDKNYSVFTTDIVANEEASGILINTSGEIIGVVIQDFSGSQDISTLTAVAISEVSGLIDRLLKGKDTPYMGVYVSTVTDTISNTYHIPKGIFVREVVTDSPAMFAGLQSGDVIVKINGEKVSSDIMYSSILSKLTPGEECELVVKRQNGNGYYEITCKVITGVLE